MSSRFMTILLLSTSCCCLAGCKDSKEEEVIQWLKKMPQSHADAEKWGVVAYPSEEEWADAGHKIEGIEDILIALLENPTDEMLDPNERLDTLHVAYALGYVGSSKSVPILSKVLEDKSKFMWVRVNAATALGGIGDPRAIEPLCRIVSCGEEYDTLRISAIAGLWMIGDPNAVPVIENALKNQQFSASYRKAALKMLEELKR